MNGRRGTRGGRGRGRRKRATAASEPARRAANQARRGNSTKSRHVRQREHHELSQRNATDNNYPRPGRRRRRGTKRVRGARGHRNRWTWLRGQLLGGLRGFLGPKRKRKG